MSKRKDTKSNKAKKSPLFPHELRKVKLAPDSWCKSHLEQYLETEDFKHLFDAIKENPKLLQGQELDLVSAGYVDELPEAVDHHTVVWTSINHWRWIYLTEEAQDVKNGTFVTEDAKKLLVNVGRSLVPERDSRFESAAKDGLIHIKPRVKGTNAFLTYLNPRDYAERYEKIKNTINKNRSKRRYGSFDHDLQRQDIYRAINELNELPLDKIQLIKLDAFRHRVISRKVTFYISIVHKLSCSKCRNGPSHDVLQNLYKSALQEIKKSNK